MINENKNFGHYLQRLNISKLNEMQEQVIASADENKQHVIVAPTGSGKTVAFLLPIVQLLDAKDKNVQAVILVPSRELALQIEDVAKKMQIGFKILACYGGHKREIEENSLVEAPAIIIGTAGRMADHIRRGNVNLSSTKVLVIDEYDKMLELGFLEEMAYILQHLKQVETRMLTSATTVNELPEFVGMTDPITLNFLEENAIEADVMRIHSVFSDNPDKLEALKHLICYARDTSSIIFANHRDAVERISNYLKEEGIINVFYHGGMEQRDREVSLTKFRNGTSNILVTTDLASRGLDIDNIRNIIHYHLPLEESSFTHRNGRTARKGNTGNVYAIYGKGETLPKFIVDVAEKFELEENNSLPEKPKWSTLFINAGKKDKISKGDIVGFLSQKGDLRQEELGLIEVKDHIAFAAVRKSKIGDTIENIKDEKLKGRSIKIAIAK